MKEGKRYSSPWDCSCRVQLAASSDKLLVLQRHVLRRLPPPSPVVVRKLQRHLSLSATGALWEEALCHLVLASRRLPPRAAKCCPRAASRPSLQLPLEPLLVPTLSFPMVDYSHWRPSRLVLISDAFSNSSRPRCKDYLHAVTLKAHRHSVELHTFSDIKAHVALTAFGGVLTVLVLCQAT